MKTSTLRRPGRGQEVGGEDRPDQQGGGEDEPPPEAGQEDESR